MGTCCSILCSNCASGETFGSSPDKLQDKTDEVYNQYQAFLGNMMLLSTLILGFVMTGTLLTPSFQGDENYGAEKVQMFLKWTAAAGIAALFTLIISFLVHARGVDVYTRRGPSRASRAMKQVLLPILVAECAMYMSLLFFGLSVIQFMQMQYVGPDICPFTSDGAELGRPSSFCGMLSSDFYGFANASCSGASSTSGSAFLCTNLKKWQAKKERAPLYYVWDMASSAEEHVQTFQKLSVEVAQGVCQASKAAGRAAQACVEPLDTPAKQQACASAYMARQTAAQCQDAKVEDAEKCRRVCGIIGGEHGLMPAPNLVSTSRGVQWLGLVAIIVFAAIRLLNSCAVTMNYHYYEIKRHGFTKSLLNMVVEEDLWKDHTSGASDSAGPVSPQAGSQA